MEEYRIWKSDATGVWYRKWVDGVPTKEIVSGSVVHPEIYGR